MPGGPLVQKSKRSKRVSGSSNPLPWIALRFVPFVQLWPLIWLLCMVLTLNDTFGQVSKI